MKAVKEYAVDTVAFIVVFGGIAYGTLCFMEYVARHCVA